MYRSHLLGILIDTKHMEIRLPEDKLLRIRQELAAWLTKRKATKKEILSLVGVLQHATKVVWPGRTFVARMYQTAAKVKELNYFTRLNLNFRSDLYWWYTFITNWNRLSILHSPTTETPVDHCIQTDASGSWGCGAYMEGQWFQWHWPLEWEPIKKGSSKDQTVVHLLRCMWFL